MSSASRSFFPSSGLNAAYALSLSAQVEGIEILVADARTAISAASHRLSSTPVKCRIALLPAVSGFVHWTKSTTSPQSRLHRWILGWWPLDGDAAFARVAASARA